ncbi:uncharacterized protein BDR25DRAFT_68740 [Lindgomyces ingoldianus]|uniref:Uncharacterized protein n=1 Tax=Lindgomyces ingoldianus TaxID=673940 RepID=A0ACB6RBN4_9PLEO|nr:uncharacterized protein BDR25DRAFT_68740 [Lindgomyces ingoldianus]KAF2476748.1 hypothetical protein BDR25DRAFT_68740 [Lindgomyces ingoldianus]
MTTYPGTGVPRDCHDRHLAETYYGMLPSSALDPSNADIRAPSIPSKRFHEAKSSASAKRKNATESHEPSIFLPRGGLEGNQYWPSTKSSKRGRLQTKQDARIELHQSTCLNLNSTVNPNLNNPSATDSDLWILPDFDEWELDDTSSMHYSLHARDGGEWAPLVSRAVNSNRERLRRRLEGDGWDFVGGKYGEDGNVYEFRDEDSGSGSGSEESVDEEFDVVVLGVEEGV